MIQEYSSLLVRSRCDITDGSDGSPVIWNVFVLRFRFRFSSCSSLSSSSCLRFLFSLWNDEWCGSRQPVEVLSKILLARLWVRATSGVSVVEVEDVCVAFDLESFIWRFPWVRIIRIRFRTILQHFKTNILPCRTLFGAYLATVFYNPRGIVDSVM